jgi:hypothetical protein
MATPSHMPMEMIKKDGDGVRRGYDEAFKGLHRMKAKTGIMLT